MAFIYDSTLNFKQLIHGIKTIVALDRTPTASGSVSSFLRFIQNCPIEVTCCMMENVGIVIRDTDGRRLNENALGDILWLRSDPTTLYSIHEKNRSIIGVLHMTPTIMPSNNSAPCA
jgi:hypothetical protein